MQREGGRGGGRERDGGSGEKRRDDYTIKGAANSSPSQKEKVDHRYEALSPNTAAQKMFDKSNTCIYNICYVY